MEGLLSMGPTPSSFTVLYMRGCESASRLIALRQQGLDTVALLLHHTALLSHYTTLQDHTTMHICAPQSRENLVDL